MRGNNMLYEIRELTKKYGEGDAQVYALKNLSIDIPKGKFIVVLGASGSGKSTLLNMLGCMDKPTSGSIIFDGKDIANLSSKEQTVFRQKKLGFVFQSYNLIPTLTAIENVEFSCEIAGLDPGAAVDAMEAVGLSGRHHHYLHQLSGGEQQRISIARAIVKKPEVLLCDEPTGALDFQTGIRILEVLRQVYLEGTSVIFITHSQDIAKMADVVIRMRSGEVIEVNENLKPLAPGEIQW